MKKIVAVHECGLCAKVYRHKSSLERHQQKDHQIVKEEAKAYPCHLCSAGYENKRSLLRHLSYKHGTSKSKQEVTCMEPACGTKCEDCLELRKHLVCFHGEKFIEENLTFGSFLEFSEWKETIEKLQPSLFTLRNTVNATKYYYYCNRSGRYSPSVDEASRKRKLKSQGSNKIGQSCPARLLVETSDDAVTVKAILRHYGHDCKLGHIPLSQGDKELIQGKILLGVSNQKILAYIRSDCAVENLQRIHLTNRKDLNNLSQNLALDQRDSNDCVSVDLFVQELERDENMEVLLFKQQGVLLDKYSLSKHDFALAFCSQFMLEMLEKFGHKVVCMDSTHGTTAYDFKLVTVMVVDEFGSGVPVAWLLSNKDSSEVLVPFLKRLREVFEEKRRKPFPSAKYFMTDKAPQFYLSWCTVSYTCPEKLLCAWHVHKDWIRKLNSLVQDNCTRQDLYEQLIKISHCTDLQTAACALDALQKKMESNPNLREFAHYFKREWISCLEEWSAANRKDAGINTNMFLEAFHKILKHTYLNGKYNKRVDKCVQSLAIFASDMVFKRIEKVEKKRESWRQAQTNQRHSEAVSAEKMAVIKQIDDNIWEVQSFKSSKTYKVVKLRPATQCKECHARCSACKCCAHTHSCTCLDNVIRGFVCKHIHAICMRQHQSLPSDATPLQECSDESKPLHTSDSILSKQKDGPNWVKKAQNLSLMLNRNLEKKGIPKEVGREICKKLECCTSLTKLSCNSNRVKYDVKRNKSSLKKISLQRKFKSTKNYQSSKMKRKNVVTLRKDRVKPLNLKTSVFKKKANKESNVPDLVISPKPSSTELLVGKFVINSLSLQTLDDDNWLDDVIVDAVVWRLAGQVGSKKTWYPLSTHYATSLFFKGKCPNGFKMLKFLETANVVTVINTGAHWIAMIKEQNKITLYDSVGNEFSIGVIILNHLRFFFKNLKFNIQVFHHSKQQDGVNCGVLALKAIQLLLSANHINAIKYDKQSCRMYRNELKKFLLNTPQNE